MSDSNQKKKDVEVIKHGGALVVVTPTSVELSKEIAARAGGDGGAADQAKPGIFADRESTTQRQVNIGGQTIAYTATAGTMLVRDEDNDDREACVFYIAYTRDGVDDPAKRPITFAFNGGPGSSSVWLHMGAWGPRRIKLTDEGHPYPPPAEIVENDLSILDVTDLVFIDPVSTGYSRAKSREEAKKFHGVKEDVESVGEFIRLYTTRNQRWSSPKFIAGESYGTTRAAGLAGHLQRRHGMYFNGLILVSSVLHFQTLKFHPGNDLPYVLYLPAYAAAAWYHKRLGEDLQSRPLREVITEAETFAFHDYHLALLKGTRLEEGERRRMIDQISRFTGLPPDVIDRRELCIPLDVFVEELLKDERRYIGRLDARYKGYDKYMEEGKYFFDPSASAIHGAFTAGLNHYLRTELSFEQDLIYEIISGQTSTWNYGEAQNRYLEVAETLRSAISQNPALKVFVCNGYFDLATPYTATEYTFSHLGLDAELRDHVEMGYYEAGHMMYIHRPSAEKLKADVTGFVNQTLAEG